jgi:hypothetical protein
MLQVTCPKCRATLRFADADRGSVVACSHCGKRLRLPAGPAVERAPQPPPEDDPSPYGIKDPARYAGAHEPEEEPSADEDESDSEEEAEEKPRNGRKLGPVKTEFRGSAGYFAIQIIGVVIVFVFGLFFLVLGFGALATSAPDVGIGTRLAAVLLFAPLGLGVVGFSIYWLVRQRQQWKQRVLLCRGGFVHIWGGRRKVYYWDDILAQYQKITDHYVYETYRNTTRVYTMECADGERLVFKDSLKNVKRLGDAIANHINRRELPLALADYDDGRLVTFGKLGVSKKGVTYGDSFLSWKEIKGVQIADGCISVSKKGKWFNWCSIGASSVPNLFVFLALVDQIKGVKGM